MQITNQAILTYAIANTTKQPALLDELTAYTAEHFPEGFPMRTGPLEGRLLNFLVGLIRAKNVLELGTFTGFSALSMAQALPEDGKLITCDHDERVVKVAKEFASRAPFGHKIEFRLGNCLDILSTLENETFDFIFIDADKMPYPEYYEKALKLLSSRGMIAIDNSLWEGQVLAPASDKRANMFVAFNQKLATDPRVQVVQLPIRDGITLVQKRPE